MLKSRQTRVPWTEKCQADHDVGEKSLGIHINIHLFVSGKIILPSANDETLRQLEKSRSRLPCFTTRSVEMRHR